MQSLIEKNQPGPEAVNTVLLNACDELIHLLLCDSEEKPSSVQLLRDLKEELASRQFSIGVFGTTASGKSSLLNALTGSDLFRAGHGETTPVPTYVQLSDESHPDGSTAITYRTEEDILLAAEDAVCKAGFVEQAEEWNDLADGHGRLMLFSPAAREKLARKVADAWPGKPGHQEEALQFLRAILSGWEAVSGKMGHSLVEYTAASTHRELPESEAVFVRERRFFHRNRLTEAGLVFVDTPGVGSNLARHTALAHEVGAAVDAALFVSRPDAKLLAVDAAFLRRMAEARRNLPSPGIYFVLNQTGTIDPYEMRHEAGAVDWQGGVRLQERVLKKKLEEIGFSNPRIFATDAVCAQWAGKVLGGNVDKMAEKSLDRYAIVHGPGKLAERASINMETSGVPELETFLCDRLATGKEVKGLRNRSLRIKQFANALRTGMEIKKEACMMGVKEQEVERERHLSNLRKLRESMNSFLDYEFPARVMDIYAGVEGEILSLINQAAEDLANTFLRRYHAEDGLSGESEHASSLEEPSPCYSTLNTKVANEVLVESLSDIWDSMNESVKELRRKYEAEYRLIRDSILEVKVPELIQEYLPGHEATLALPDYETAIEPLSYDSARSRVKMWQLILAAARSPFNRAERCMGLANQVKKIFITHFAPDLEHELVGWITSDQSALSQQIVETLTGLTDAVREEFDQKGTLLELSKAQKQTVEKESDVLLRSVAKIEADVDRVVGLLESPDADDCQPVIGESNHV